MTELDYAGIFREETAELLEELETSLLALEKSPEDLALVGRVFRAMHTIKGSGAMFGFEEIAGFTHHVETALDRVRSGAMPVTRALIDLVLAARDHIKILLEAAGSGVDPAPERGQELIAALKALQEGGSAGVAGAAAQGAEGAAGSPRQEEEPAAPLMEAGPLVHYRLRFLPGSGYEEAGIKEEELFRELEKLGECTIFPAEKEENGSFRPVWDILLSTPAGQDAIRDVFIFVEHLGELRITPLGQDGAEAGPVHRRLGEILVERGDLHPEDVQRVLSQQKPLGEMLVDAKLVNRSQVQSALAEQEELKRKAAAAAQPKGSIRVASEKLDKLINLVGELVVTQARLSQVSAGLEQSELLEPVEEVERLTAELRDVVLNIRMLPIGTTFAKFSRLVRDLSAELGKEIDLVTEGAETELDKTVIDQLGDPLIHLIRNCIDHGLETPVERGAAGKPRRGRIRLSAGHSGAKVIISVQDDGRGIDPEKIRAKALASGLLKPGEELTDRQVLKLIFAAGFSTAEKVTSVSGRGVGMDVVRSAVEALRGSVAIDSTKGVGSTVTITLPLTLAIIDGLLVRAGETSFVLPLSAVEECVEITSLEVAKFHGRRLLPVRERLVPYVRLREFFGMDGDRPEREQMVVVRMDGDQVGLVLDTVIGGHQTVIKSLGWVYRHAEGLSGSTILGSGEVALIIDVPQLIQHAKQEETTGVGARIH